MNSEKLLDAMDFIDEGYINNVYTLKTHPKSYKRNIIKYISIAACVVFAFIGAVAIGLFDGSNKVTMNQVYNNNVGENVDGNSSTDVPIADDVYAGNANPNDSANENPSTPPKEEPTTFEEPTTIPEEPSTDIDERPTYPVEPPNEDVVAGVTRPIFVAVRVLYAYDNRLVVMVLDNKGDEDLENWKIYDMSLWKNCDIDITNVKIGDKLNIMCAYDNDELILYYSTDE